MSDHTVSVKTLSADEYQIKIGADLIEEASQFASQNYSDNKAFVIVDEQVYVHHEEVIEKSLDQHFKNVSTYVVPRGEKSKSFGQYSDIIDFVLNDGAERGTPLLAIGGGVVGDLAGFVAASVLRGIPLIHIPTTLLAMVDSAIGGKTGINHTTGKNLIGAFYQPKAVFSDVNFLATLERKEWVNGLSEIIKYGMIDSPEILDELVSLTSGKDFAAPEAWIPVITKSASIKADIVSRDVKESGVREFLNFGHTFAHVIEAKGNYEMFSHGEAVFAGMYGAAEASNKTGGAIEMSNLMQFKPLYDLSLAEIGSDYPDFTRMMLRDKKVKNQTIRLVLLNKPGAPVVKAFEETAFIDECWQKVLTEFN